MGSIDGSTVRLADILRHPDDLDKIAALKADLTRKKAGADAQLRASLQEQLEITQSGMGGITDGQRTVQLIKEEMMKIDKLCAEGQSMIRDFPNINLVAQTHRNFSAVEAMRTNLETFNDRLGQVERMLQEDADDEENMPNLLAVHYELTQLRDIRDDAMDQIERAEDASLQHTLEDYFQKLDDTVDWFNEHLGNIALNLINLLISGNNGLVVRMAVIIEAEEKSDMRVLALQQALKDHKDMASRFKSIKDGSRKARGYKEKFLEAIKIYADSQVEEAKEKFLDNPDILEKSMRWFFNDLNAAKQGLVPLMPKRWKVFQTYGNIYHKIMHDYLVGVLDDPETSFAHMLAIINWPDKYYAKMTKLGYNIEELEPHVIDSRETELVREFRQRIIKSLDDWINRIVAMEKKDFDERNVDGSNLDADEFGYFRTRNLVDLWRMLREQTDVAGNSKRTDVVEGVVDAMFARLKTRQRTWQQMLDDEADKYTRANADMEGFQALQDWLIATANDQIACIDDNEEEERFGYLTSYRQNYEPLVAPSYLEHGEMEVAMIRDGYVDLSTHCISKFAELVFLVDFKTVLPDFFTAKWYTSTVMKQMIVTFEEYVSDYRKVLHHSLLDIFIEELADELLIRYLSCVRNKGAKCRRSDPFEEKLFDDVSTAFQFFAAAPGPDTGLAIKQKWRVTEHFSKLLLSEKAAVPDRFADFKREHWDLQLSWVEAVLRMRDDFDRGLLNGVKTRAAQIEVERGPETIMSRLK